VRTLGLALGLLVFLALDLVLGGLLAPLRGGPNFTLLFVLFAALYIENVSPVVYWTAGLLLDLVVAPRPGLYALTLLVLGVAIASVRSGRKSRPGLAAQAAACFACALAAEAVYGLVSGAVAALGWRALVDIVLGAAVWGAVLGPPVFFVTRCVGAFLGLQWREPAAGEEGAGGSAPTGEAAAVGAPGAWRH